MQFWIPKGNNRFHFVGGSRFVHGGAMLQEVVVPVVTVREKEGTSREKTRTTQVPVIELLTDAVNGGLISNINTKKAQWSDPAVTGALSTFKSYISAGYVNADYKTAKYTDQISQLVAGKVAMVPQGSWMNSSFTGDASNIDFIAFPSSSGKVTWQSSNLASIMLPKTKNSANEKAARDFVDYATVGDGYKAYLSAAKEPSVINGVADPAKISQLQQATAALYANGSIPSVDMQSAASFGDFPTLVSQLIAGTANPDSIAKQMQSAFEQNAKLIGVSGF